MKEKQFIFQEALFLFSKKKNEFKFLKHIGIYLFRKDILFLFHSLKKSYLEEKENLEQLRLIQNGIPIFVFEAKNDTHPVDKKEDIKEVEKILKSQK
jgi:3-deoxy-manno-octulosonate cytidylyltransferase (CMP-KDO synthetase)